MDDLESGRRQTARMLSNEIRRLKTLLSAVHATSPDNVAQITLLERRIAEEVANLLTLS